MSNVASFRAQSRNLMNPALPFDGRFRDCARNDGGWVGGAMRIVRCALMPLLVFALGPAFAAESCGEDEYRTAVGGCYPVWHGQTPNGAYYTIAIPEGWIPGKGLVIWNHGLQTYLGGDTLDLLTANLLGLEAESDIQVMGEVAPEPSLGDVASIVLSQGYAMAASSFLQTGWAVFDSHLANAELYERFLEISAEFGPEPPTPLYLLGGSMGGIVSLRDMEEGLIPEPDGALLLCGAVAGSENWRNAFDLRMIAETVCAGEEESAFPTPWYEIPALGREIDWIRELDSCTALGSRIAAENKHDDLQAEIDELRARKAVEGNILREFDLQRRIAAREVEQRIVMQTWKQLSSNRQVGNYERLQRLAPTESAVMLSVGLFYGTFLLPRLIQETGKLNGLNPFHNIAADYGDDWLNRRIGRGIGLPAARRALAANYNPSGEIGDTRIVSIHTSRDGIVAVENQAVLQSLLPPEQLSVGIVAESAPTHCGFRESEVIAAWNLLQRWVEGGPQPDVAALQEECRAVSGRTDQGAIPRDWDRAPDGELHSGNRCRYAPDFEIDPELTLYPREPATRAEGNVFDAATGVIGVAEMEAGLEGAIGLFSTELQLTDLDRLVFAPRNTRPLDNATENWRHRAAVDEQFRFYLPDLGVRNDPNLAGQRFNVYMQLTEALEFEFIDFEPADIAPQ